MEDFLVWLINEKRMQKSIALDNDRDRIELEIRMAERYLDKEIENKPLTTT